MTGPNLEAGDASHPHVPDQSRIGWALDDLDRFEDSPWSGEHTIMAPEKLHDIREAARIVTEAFKDGVLVFVDPAAAEREELNDKVVDRLVSYTDAYGQLSFAIEGALEDFNNDMIKLEVYGGGKNPVTEAIDDIAECLRAALDSTAKTLRKYNEPEVSEAPETDQTS